MKTISYIFAVCLYFCWMSSKKEKSTTEQPETPNK
jgi:hypothetical protein